MYEGGKTSVFSKLKKRWNIDSNFQLILILLVFSITGSASLVVKKWITTMLGIPSDIHFFYKILLFIFITFPAYQLLLLLIALVFGQFRFFWAFQKKSIGRIFRMKRAEKK